MWAWGGSSEGGQVRCFLGARGRCLRPVPSPPLSRARERGLTVGCLLRAGEGLQRNS
jgi:hypothetical protein